MKATHLALPDVILLEPKVFGDDRGFFFKSFNQAKDETLPAIIESGVELHLADKTLIGEFN